MSNTFRVRLVGVRPLMMSSSAGVAPAGDKGERLRELNEKRKLTAADQEERRRLKYEFALYCDDDGVYIPGHNIWAAGREAAKRYRQGEAWKQGVQVIEDRVPLLYDGPRTPEELYADRRFVDVRIAVLNGKQRIEAIRPIFPRWQVEATFAVDDEFISAEHAQRALTTAGRAKGLGTYRERFGRFETTILAPSKRA